MSNLLFAELLCDMFSMEGGAPADYVAGRASVHRVETAQSPLAHLGNKQALASLHCASEDQLRYNVSAHEETTQSYQDSKMIIDDK